MKTCGVCKIQKPYDDFNKRKTSKDGLKSYCRACAAESNKKRYAKSKEKIMEKIFAYYSRNRDSLLTYKKQHYRNNFEKYAELASKRYRENPEDAKARVSAWQRMNPQKVYVHVVKRRAEQLKATPRWADEEKIRAIYAEANRITLETGIPHHVDHIVPLRGPIARSGPFKGFRLVHGLHWEGNLRIITGHENRLKSNMAWPDMP